MRTYFEKARTSLGWKGVLHDPLLDGSNQIAHGSTWARALLCLADLEIPTACEFLDPALNCYIGDLISWGCIGARTSTSQVHAKLLRLPNLLLLGKKNTTEGNVEAGVHGVFSAAAPHTFVGMDRRCTLGGATYRGQSACPPDAARWGIGAKL